MCWSQECIESCEFIETVGTLCSLPQSAASDMRFDGIFTEKEVIQESKRQRVINSRYRGDYVEPVIYRAIME